MWIPTWSCLLLSALSVHGEESQDHNQVSTNLSKNHLLDVSKNVTILRNSTNAIDDQSSEARILEPLASDVSSVSAHILNVDLEDLFHFFQFSKVSGDWSKNEPVRKWFQYLAEQRRTQNHNQWTDTRLYNLLKQFQTEEQLHDLFQELKHEQNLQSC
ncbi:RxLR-like protein [Plasmopara halstedii]|uniref:RxLR-like protein n=1 Tax=Plasmopara halstedii TaxID=4781 RepID=A0A0N7L3H9_PLAHL|nr:RxLR-like protein [Plasmopara halstedii]CEG35923.1 RxLR-like protein [Plasmopara halstedii]|eukprot:XP_024572292.1 RxLR-like protein [Plasmopara halstedii]